MLHLTTGVGTAARDITDPEPDFVVIDVETACARVSSICQVGIVGFKDGREIFEYETLVDPRDDFHVFNTRIHGIAAEHVAGQPTFGDIHPIVARYLSGRTTVAHSHFDKGALAAACNVHDRAVIETTWLDSVRVAKRAWPDLENHRLGLLARYLGLAHTHHDALSDARAAGWVIVKAIDHTGLSLEDWLAPPRKAGPPPRAAAEGPLSGERVVILGEPRDGKLAHLAASLGARVMTAIGRSTTMMVVAGAAPFDRTIRTNAAFRKAEDYRRSGGQISILPADALHAIAATSPR